MTLPFSDRMIIKFFLLLSGVFAASAYSQSSTLSIDTNDYCLGFHKLIDSYDQNDQYLQEYDSSVKFIQTCYNSDHSWEVFQNAAFGVTNINLQDTSRFRKFRYWLISVLFLNRIDPLYFCFDMYNIANTYIWSEHDRFPNAQSSIYRWMEAHHLCSSIPWNLWDSLAMAANHDEWVGNGSKGTFDTNMNSMHELGLDFLDSFQAGIQTRILTSLSEFNAFPNPFSTSLTVCFTLDRFTDIAIAIYDELGRWIWGDTHGTSLEAGEHSVHIDASKWESGRYYARISTGFGEVKTVKFVKKGY